MEAFCVTGLPCTGQDKRDIMYMTVRVKSQTCTEIRIADI